MSLQIKSSLPGWVDLHRQHLLQLDLQIDPTVKAKDGQTIAGIVSPPATHIALDARCIHDGR